VGFGQDVLFLCVLGGILGSGCADGLICGGETSVLWVGSCGLMASAMWKGLDANNGGGGWSFF